MNTQKFDIYNNQNQRIYIGMKKTDFGYMWDDGYGFITNEQIKAEKWSAILVL